MKTDANWNVVVYQTFIEIVPIGDLKKHYFGDECWCNPKITFINGKPDKMISHHALDNRY